MINLQPPAGNTVLTVIKPVGKSIALVIGDIVEAEITDVLETGGITLKINGSFLTARTEVPLQKDAVALFKVLPDRSGAGLKLQFLGYSGKTTDPRAARARQDNIVERAISDLAGILLKEGTDSSKSFHEAFDKILRPLTPDSLLAAQEFQVQVRQMLRAIMDSSGFFQAFLPHGWKGLRRGDMSFRKVRRDKGSSYSCGIELDLAKYGKISIDLLVADKEFFAFFRVADEGLKQTMNAHLSELKEAFTGMGSSLNVSFLDKAITQEGTGGRSSRESIVDIKA